MQALILPFLYCLLLGSAWAVFFRKRFSDSLAPALMLHMIIVLLCGMAFHRLSVGIYGGIALSAAVLAWRLKKEWPGAKELARTLWDGGVFVFFALYIFCFFSNLGRGFIWWDEFGHWGIVVKESLRLDMLFAESPLPLAHKHYVPAVTLFEVIWCRLSGRFLEADVFRAIQMVMFAMMLPMFNSFAPQCTGSAAPARGLRRAFCSRLNQLAAVFFVMPLPQLFLLHRGATYFYTSIYADLFLGMVFFYCVMLAWRDEENKKYQALALALGFATLLLTKQTGIMLLPFVLALYIAKLALLDAREARPLATACVAAAAAAAVLLWYSFTAFDDAHVAYCNEANIMFCMEGGNIQTYAGFRAARLLEVLKSPERSAIEHLAEFRKMFAHAFFHERPILIWRHGAFMPVVIFIVMLAFALAWTREDAEQRRKIRLAGYFIVVSAICYAALMFLLYPVVFMVREYITLASYERYMGTFLLALVLFAVLLYYDAGVCKKYAAVSYAVLAVQFGYLLLFQSGMCAQVWQGDETAWNGGTALARYAAERLNAATPEDAKIYVVLRGAKGRPSVQIPYLAHPKSVHVGRIGPGEDVDPAPGQLRDALKNFDYLYFLYRDAAFTEKYSAIFERPELLKNDAVYKITGSRGGLIALERVAMHGGGKDDDFLLHEGVDVNAAMIDAAWYGYWGVVRMLLDKGADVNAESKDGSTAIRIAMERRDSEALALLPLLLEKGANPNQANKDGAMPLHMAAARGHVDIARVLLAHGADVNAANKNSTTPLMEAVWHGNLEAVKLLLAHGADVRAADINGGTALLMAESRKQAEIVQLLKAAGAEE